MTILHQESWLDFPSARPNYDTTNTSFLKMVDLYIKMGVKNNLWPLALLNQELKYINPHDPNLGLEEMVAIKNECKYNPWYYFREIVRIPPVAGNSIIPFRANRGNMALLWCYFNNTDFALIQPRQTGKSVSTDCLMDLLIYIMAENSLFSLITKDDGLRKINVERLKKIRRQIPAYLIPLTKSDTDNQFELTCKTLGNRYTTGVAQAAEFAANNLGRGITSPSQHFDEPPFITHIGVTLPAALAAGTAAREEAELNGQPCGNIFTTTAGKKDDRDGKYMYDFIMGGAYWDEKYLDAGSKKILKEMVYRNCRGDKILINGTFNHRQLGYTDEWLYRAIAEAGSKGEQADRDFFNVWTSGTQRSPLSVELNKIIRESEMDSLHTTVSKDLYMIKWYLEEHQIQDYMDNNTVIISIDSSEAVGRDAIAMRFCDITNMATIATGSYNETNLIRFSNYLADLLVVYPNTILVIEKKSSGQSIIDLLLMVLPKYGIDPFKRIYNRLVEEMDIDKEAWRILNTPNERRDIYFYDSIKNKFGYNTTGSGAQSRDLLYRIILQEAAKKGGRMVRDKQLIDEILGLVVKNDRIDHANSGHDDMVIAWLLSCWFLTHSKNLSFYGIETSQILSDIRTMDREYTIEEQWEMIKQKKIKAEIQEVIALLEEERDSIQMDLLENRLNHLSTQYRSSDGDVESVDQLIQQIKETKQSQLQNQQRRVHIPAGSSWRDANRRYF